MDIAALRKQWHLTKACLQATWCWRVFGINAMQRWWTKLLVAVAIIAGFWSLFFYVELLNPVLPLEQLTKHEGELIKVSLPFRVHNSSFRIRTNLSNEILYRASIYNRDSFRASKGKRITVWSQTYYRLWWPFYFEQAWEVQQGDQFLMNYKGVYSSMLRFKPNDEWLAKYLMILTALSLAIVVLVCRKTVPTEASRAD